MEHDHDALDAAPPGGGEVGWYQHPARSREHRYWDGLRWVQAPEDAPATAAAPGTTVADGRDVVIAAELWWHPASDRLVWSEDAALMHGYHGLQPEVTRELMLDHVVETDRASVAACFAQGHQHAAQLRSHHRIHCADGAGREVVMVAALEGSAGASTYHGFLVDLGPQLLRAANDAVEAARRGNGAVQRAVGVLSVVLGLETETALAVLRRASSDSNVKLRDLAQQVVDAAGALSAEPGRAPARLRRLLQRPDRPATRMAPVPRVAPPVEPPAEPPVVP